MGMDGCGAEKKRGKVGRPKVELVLSDSERAQLERYRRRGKTSQRLALRASIVLECAKGLDNATVASKLNVSQQTVCKWRGRFVRERVGGLCDAPRSGAPRRISDEKVEQVVVATLESMPRGASRWSVRAMAKHAGISRDSVQRIWHAFGLKPHRNETFQFSSDPDFVDKVRDVVGLYMDPPDNAVVLSVDEKTQIQALNRTQPVLPMRPGQMERRTPEYCRHGTTSLFAALDVATGAVIGRCFKRHRAAEFVKFLKLIDESVDPELDVHVIADNYATHKAPAVRRWLARHPRFTFHFTPTHASWLNQVECWFAILTEKMLKRSSHRSVRELEADIYAFLDANNESPRPFLWTKSADRILDNVASFCSETLKVHRGPKN